MSDYRAFPRMLYRDGSTSLVYDEEGLAVALEAGWRKVLTLPAMSVEAVPTSEAVAPDVTAAPAKRKPGRPKLT